MVNEDVVLVAIVDGIGTITINRPEKRNAMDGNLVLRLQEELKILAENPAVGVVFLQANGEHFCAGADIAWMQKMASGPKEQNMYDAIQLADLMRSIYTFAKPVIVLAQGATMGGGLGLLAACDIAIAADNAFFAFSETKIGITPSVVSPYIVAALGERIARYYFLTAARFDAQEAYRIGLIQQIVPLQDLTSTAVKIAQGILHNGPKAVMEAKRLIRNVALQPIDEELSQITAEHLAKMRASIEAKEGLSAFIEKRLARW